MSPDKEKRNYDDIINLPHYVSKERQPMSMLNRAAQFSSFAALNGHDEAIGEVARITSKRRELTSDEAAILSKRLNYLLSLGKDCPMMRFTYFIPDSIKDGGRYVTVAGRIRHIEPALDLLYLYEGPEINLSTLISILPANP